MSSEKRFRIGVDTGGTFVDAVEFDEETRKFRMAKSPTTPSDPTIGFLNALQKLGTPLDQTYLILHGTTLGVNAIIQMKGVLTGMITNQGFKDVFEIGRGDVPSASMYDYNYLKPPRIVKRRHIAEIPGRIDHEGNIIRDLDEQAANVALRRLVDDQKVRSIAVSLLHSYKNADHEERIKSIASKTHPNLSVSISSEVVSEYREYERTSTTVLDAYIKPIIAEYLHKLERTLNANGFRGLLLITRSDGGMMTAATAANSPISTVQSGPAGGVVGGSHLALLLWANLGRQQLRVWLYGRCLNRSSYRSRSRLRHLFLPPCRRNHSPRAPPIPTTVRSALGISSAASFCRSRLRACDDPGGRRSR